MRELVSVIIPVYNKEHYVARAIASVLSQTYRDLELIIVNDASQDNSMARVAEFSDPRIRVLQRFLPGPGGYAARNLGVQASRGDWIAFLDADDVWMANHLDKAMQLIPHYPNAMIISAARLHRTGCREQLDPYAERYIKQGPQVLDLTDYLRHACSGQRAMGTNSVLVRRCALVSHRIFPEGRTNRSGDLYAWVALMAHLKLMVWSPHVACIYNADMQGVSRSNTPSIELFRSMVEELRPSIDETEERWLRLYANRMIKYAWLEQKKKRLSLPLFRLPGSLFWQNNVGYCIKWTLISLVPFGILEWLKQRFM
ncbi:MAG: glycosyltransferase family 2 protein [Pseudomonadota bacterium]